MGSVRIGFLQFSSQAPHVGGRQGLPSKPTFARSTVHKQFGASYAPEVDDCRRAAAVLPPGGPIPIAEWRLVLPLRTGTYRTQIEKSRR